MITSLESFLGHINNADYRHQIFEEGERVGLLTMQLEYLSDTRFNYWYDDAKKILSISAITKDYREALKNIEITIRLLFKEITGHLRHFVKVLRVG